MARIAADMAIVGGGILGVTLAQLAALAGHKPIVFRMSDGNRPSADSLRNQAWLQTGLRYAQFDPALGALMWQYGRRLHEHFSLPVPNGRGLFQVANETEAANLEQRANALHIGDIRRLGPREATSQLGEHYFPGSCVIETPEAPFDEAFLIREATAAAKLAGASFVEVSGPIEVATRQPSDTHPRLMIDGQTLEFEVCVLAAGAGNAPLLKNLGHSVGLKLRQTPLMVIPGEPTIKTGILVDHVGQYSLVAHAPGSCRSDGCMVFGADIHQPDVPYCLPQDRKVDPADVQRLRSALPPVLAQRGQAGRITAGVEVITVVDGVDQPTARPYVDFVSGCSDVVVAMPGRATLALFAAEQILEKIGSRRLTETEIDVAQPWDGKSVHMHHETFYDHLNDI